MVIGKNGYFGFNLQVIMILGFPIANPMIIVIFCPYVQLDDEKQGY